MRKLLLCLGLGLLPLTGFCSSLSFPAHTPPVTDEAGVLHFRDQKKLEALLSEIPHFKVEVVTLSSSRGLDPADYGYQLGRHWAVGEAATDNGILFIIIPSQRQVRLETGYGAEQALTDAQASRLLQQEVIPFFQQGDIPAGILNGAEKLAALLQQAAPVQRIGNQLPMQKALPPLLLILLLAGGLVFLLFLMWFLVKQGKTYTKELQEEQARHPKEKTDYYKQWLASVKKTGQAPPFISEKPSILQERRLCRRRFFLRIIKREDPPRQDGGSFGGGGAGEKW